jgi:lysophosphatidate acyltransferase
MAILSYITTGIASYFTLTVSFFALSAAKVPKAGFVARCLSSYASLLICATYGVIASIVLRLVGYGRVSQWATARSFKWVMRYSTGVHFDIIEGQQYLSTRPAVFIGNHQTELDVLMLGAIFPPYCSVTAKKSLKSWPFLGWFMALSGTVFIDRANRETAVKAFDGAAREMQEFKQSVFIFPEGTRSYSSQPELLPFKKGAFHLAVKAGVPIVPIVVENYSHVLNARKFVFEAGSIRIKGESIQYGRREDSVLISTIVLPPIETKGLQPSDVDKLTTDTREAMLKTLTGFSHGSKEKEADGRATSTAVEI